MMVLTVTLLENGMPTSQKTVSKTFDQKIPTANSAQMMRKIKITPADKKILNFRSLTFRRMKLISKPNENMSVPPTMKSNGLQFTSELTKVATRNTLRIMSVKSAMRRTRFGFDKVNIFVRFWSS